MIEFGFLTDAEVARLAAGEDTRLTQVLVRCGGCRFVAAAQDVARIIAALEAAGDYVRGFWAYRCTMTPAGKQAPHVSAVHAAVAAVLRLEGRAERLVAVSEVLDLVAPAELELALGLVNEQTRRRIAGVVYRGRWVAS